MNMVNAKLAILQGTGQPFDTYLHQLSHELRTPLNHINGFAELILLDDDLSTVNAKYVEAILEGSEALQTAVLAHIEFMELVMATIQASA